MIGNVWEWTADWFETYKPGEVRDPKGAAAGDRKAIRGGGFNGGVQLWLNPAFRYHQLGHGELSRDRLPLREEHGPVGPVLRERLQLCVRGDVDDDAEDHLCEPTPAGALLRRRALRDEVDEDEADTPAEEPGEVAEAEAPFDRRCDRSAP
jgi:hypothetical protein